MKTIIQLVLVSALCVSFRINDKQVYICNNKNTEVYHILKSCKALKKCSHEIITVSKTDAESKYAKRACKMCS